MSSPGRVDGRGTVFESILTNLQVYRWRLGKGNLAPVRSDDIYTAMGAQATVLASEPFVLPAEGYVDGSGETGEDDGETDDDAKAQPDDEAVGQESSCDPELPMSDPDSC